MRKNKIKVYEANIGDYRIRNTNIDKIISQLDAMGHQARRDSDPHLAETYFQAAHHWIVVKNEGGQHG